MKYVSTKELYDLSQTLAAPLLEKTSYPWEMIPMLHDFILEIGMDLPEEEYELIGDNIWIGKNVRIAATASISGPCIIGKNTKIRPGAYIRGDVIIGEGAIVGNSTELKNAILFNYVEVPHYNYVGDSVLGCRAHMGAGAITSNFKATHDQVVIRDGGEEIPTGFCKVGAMLGDGADIGCNSVLNPGTVVGAGSIVYPLSNVRGVVPAGHIYKNADKIVKRQ